MKKTVLITGASRGIGKAIALSFAQANTHLVLHYTQATSHTQDLLAQLQAKGSTVCEVCGDISDFDQAKDLVAKAMEATGRLDVVVNNAGISRDGLLMKVSEEDFDRTLQVNLKGTFNTMRHASRVMMKQKSGCIVNLSSVIGLRGNAGQSAYAASKAGVIGLTMAAAKELAGFQIRVNAVAPGYIETDMTGALDSKVQEKILQHIGLGYFGSAQQVADAVVFLASDQASYITGQVLQVDGGMIV